MLVEKDIELDQLKKKLKPRRTQDDVAPTMAELDPG